MWINSEVIHNDNRVCVMGDWRYVINLWKYPKSLKKLLKFHSHWLSRHRKNQFFINIWRLSGEKGNKQKSEIAGIVSLYVGHEFYLNAHHLVSHNKRGWANKLRQYDFES